MNQKRKLAAIMFSDVVDYTTLMEKDEQTAIGLLENNRRIQKPIIKKYRGKFLKEMGDGILASFKTITEAVYCAIEIQETCKNVADLKLRIGIHQGEVIYQGEDVFGSGVNIASRLENMAPAGGIYVSDTVFRNIQNQYGIEAELIGEENLRNVKHPIKVYEITLAEGKSLSDNPFQKEPTNKISYFIATIIIVILIIAGIFLKNLPWERSNTIDPDVEKSIALLPFKNLSPEEENQYFCDGVMEGILNNLSQIKDLRVLSRSSTDKYRETTPPVPTIAEELNVNYLVEASVFKSEDNIRITAQLIDARDDDHIWSKQYDRKMGDIFNVMSDISQKVASEIEVAISPEVKERIESVPTENEEAYELFLKGLEYSRRHSISYEVADINSSIYFFERAIEMDTTFATAYAYLGNALWAKNMSTGLSIQNVADTAKILAEKAISLDSNLADGYFLLATYFNWIGNDQKALQNSIKSIELNPNSKLAYGVLAIIYFQEGEQVKSIENLNKAKKLIADPADDLDILLWNGIVHMYLGDVEESEKIFKEISNHSPLTGYSYLSDLSEGMGEWEKMKTYIDQICEIDSGIECYSNLSDWHMHTGSYSESVKFEEIFRSLLKQKIGEESPITREYAYILYQIGKKEEAKGLLRKQLRFINNRIDLNEGSYVLQGKAFYDLASIYAFLGEKDNSLDILRMIENEPYSYRLIGYIHVDPLFDNLRGDKEFEQIIQRQEKKFAKIRAEIDRLEGRGLF